MNKKQLSSSEVKRNITHLIENNQKLAAEGKKTISMNIIGNAGIGKTSLVHQIAKEMGVNFVRVNLAEVQPDDFLGYPVKEFEYTNGEDSAWIPEALIPNYLSRGYNPTHRNQMSYAKPAWLTGKEDKPLVMFLDDFSRANLALLQATMTLVDEQKYISWSLPAGSTVLLSSNPDTGDYLVTSFDKAQKTRMLEMEMKFDINDWMLWAEEDGVDGRCINFIGKNTEVVEGIQDLNEKGEKIIKANIRLWTKYFYTIGGISNWSDNLEMLMNFGTCLPEEHMLLFTQFINNKLDRLPTSEQLLNNDEKWVMSELTSLIGKEGSTKRQDLAALLLKRLMNYVVINEDKLEKKKHLNRMAAILDSDLFGKDLILIALKRIISLKTFNKILSLPEYPGLFSKFR